MIDAIMIEDDGELAEILTEFLAKKDIKVTNYSSPDVGLSALEFKKFDIAILDLSLPDMDGIEVCDIITKNYKLPLIISSARSDISDKITTLKMGADDYLPKPYDPLELVARIYTVLRRYNSSKDLDAKSPQVQKKQSDFTLDENAMEIKLLGKPLKLTNAEYGILRYFIQKQGFVVSREDIINSVDAINYESSEKSIDVIVSRIRSKIGENTKNPKYIQAVRGVGYKFNG